MFIFSLLLYVALKHLSSNTHVDAWSKSRLEDAGDKAVQYQHKSLFKKN